MKPEQKRNPNFVVPVETGAFGFGSVFPPRCGAVEKRGKSRGNSGTHLGYTQPGQSFAFVSSPPVRIPILTSTICLTRVGYIVNIGLYS